MFVMSRAAPRSTGLVSGNQADMVQLCLSVPVCEIGLKDQDGLTAFDIAFRAGDKRVMALFYASMAEMEETDPQAALLRMLTLSSELDENRPVFPGGAIFEPIQDRNLLLVIALLEHGVDLTTKDNNGNTALHIAAGLFGGAEITKRLLQAGSDIEARDDEGATELHHAARSAEMETVQILLDGNADTTIEDVDGKVALEWAPRSAQQGVARMIQNYAARVATGDGSGRMALKQAQGTVQSERVVFAKPEVHSERQMAPNPTGSKMDAGKGRRAERTKKKISHLELKNDEGRTALLEAAHNGDLEHVQILLSLGAELRPGTRTEIPR